MKVKITSDGTSSGTKIVNLETGEEIKGCFAFEMAGRTGSAMQVVLHCYATLAEYEGPAEVILSAMPFRKPALPN